MNQEKKTPSLSFGYEGKLAPCADVPFSKKTHYVGLFFEFGYFGEKMTFFHDPDGLPIEIHE